MAFLPAVSMAVGVQRRRKKAPLEPQRRHAGSLRRPSHSLSIAEAGMTTVTTLTILCSGEVDCAQARHALQ